MDGKRYLILTSGGYTDIFLTKINSNDSYGGTKTIGSGAGVNNQLGLDLLIKSDGSFYYVGSIEKRNGSGAVDMDPTTGTDTKNPVNSFPGDFFITKMNSENSYAWTKLWSGTGISNAWSITTNSNVDYYIAGYFNGTIDFDLGAGVDNKTALGTQDVFVMKFNADDSYAWTKTFGGTSMNTVYTCVRAYGKSIYLCSYFNGTVDFNLSSSTVSKTSSGGRDIFILKLDQ
jgi:hypothetical protein